MEKNIFEEKIKPWLVYVGIIGAVLTSIAYMVMVIVLIRGFQYQQTTQTIIFAVANAAVGMVIASLLRYQGTSFAKSLPENQKVIKDYYENKTKDKKNHSLNFYWITTTIKDVIFKGCSVAASTLGLVYIVIIGSNDWSLLGIAVVNLLLFICFGLLALNQAYDYYNNIYVNYMKDKINDKEDTKNRWTKDLTNYVEYLKQTSMGKENKPVSIDSELVDKIVEGIEKCENVTTVPNGERSDVLSSLDTLPSSIDNGK